MEAYFAEASYETPKVVLDPESNQFEISGNSYPENSTKVFQPILEWLDTFIANGSNQDISVDFNLDYFNTSSAKYILEVLRKFRAYQDAGPGVHIRWYYFEDDTDMLEAGEDYMDTVSMEFELIEKPDDDDF